MVAHSWGGEFGPGCESFAAEIVSEHLQGGRSVERLNTGAKEVSTSPAPTPQYQTPSG